MKDPRTRPGRIWTEDYAPRYDPTKTEGRVLTLETILKGVEHVRKTLGLVCACDVCTAPKEPETK